MHVYCHPVVGKRLICVSIAMVSLVGIDWFNYESRAKSDAVTMCSGVAVRLAISRATLRPCSFETSDTSSLCNYGMITLVVII